MLVGALKEYWQPFWKLTSHSIQISYRDGSEQVWSSVNTNRIFYFDTEVDLYFRTAHILASTLSWSPTTVLIRFPGDLNLNVMKNASTPEANKYVPRTRSPYGNRRLCFTLPNTLNRHGINNPNIFTASSKNFKSYLINAPQSSFFFFCSFCPAEASH